ncbi:hypothetical protein EW146_g3717 [Bondarzewia mesenterica]|uniref:DUF6534 domain-containing protein n=1 Tax=Bondarzewia mesenterica TaxID=1095465 RepID=A0A4S4LX89_9AGAM|nr:hypothetical protein EW146_g3717 [Bondarzewia mesenterica]
MDPVTRPVGYKLVRRFVLKTSKSHVIDQQHLQFTRRDRDRRGIHHGTYFYGVLVLEVVQTVTTTHQTWWYMVTNWNNPASLVLFPWSAMTVPTIDGLIAALVQSFYSWRIWTLSRSRTMKCISILIFVVALIQGLVAMVTASYFAAHSSRGLLNRLHPAFATWLATSLAADILVAASMLWILYTAKAHTMWPESESLIARLITNAIGTGAAVAVCGLITLILFVTSPENSLQYLSGAYLLGKLYSNSVMVTLNARRSSRALLSTRGSSNAQSDSFPMRIRVARQVHTMHDGLDVPPSRTDSNELPGSQEKGRPFFDLGDMPLPQSKDVDVERQGPDVV